VSYPTDLKYSDEHEWIRVDGDAGTVGITAYAAEQVGDIVFVELPKVGDTLAKGKPFGVIESVKAVSELFAPVSGTVTAVNDGLVDAPEAIAADPHGDGWLVKVTIADAAELGQLKDAAAYEGLIGT
jgi:glycine cleavage system H protein